ncbi:MAG: SDR family oxidoreductase [Patescibacteria group bacterium]
MSQKTILITGSSTGIGRATALHFQEQGWNVVATMRSPEKEAELTKLDNVLVTKLDVQDESTIASAVSETIEKFGQINVLVNNAGYGAMGALEAFDMDGIRRQFDVNVIGLLAVTKAIVPHMRERKDGTIINISSIGGKMAFPLLSLYHGTKFAVEGISESMAYELAEFGVKMKLVEPGAIATDFGSRSMDMQNDESLEEYQPLVGKVAGAFQAILSGGAAPASIVAETIYEAATDGTNTLRYLVGEDAKAIAANRASQDDAAFTTGIKSQFNL